MESVAHFKWAAGLLLKDSATVPCYQWGNAGLITLPIRARMSIEASTADGRGKRPGKENLWINGLSHIEEQRGKSICQLIAHHHGSGVTRRTSTVQLHAGSKRFIELLLCALKPKNIYFMDNSVLGGTFHIISFGAGASLWCFV